MAGARRRARRGGVECAAGGGASGASRAGRYGKAAAAAELPHRSRGGGRGAEYAERGGEVEIYYYPKDAHAPRNELLTAAEALRCALGEGVDIGGVWLYPEDGIETDASDGVLAAMLRLEWIETAGEPEGEPMEELEYKATPHN